MEAATRPEIVHHGCNARPRAAQPVAASARRSSWRSCRSGPACRRTGAQEGRTRRSRPTAPHAILIDAESGTVLFERNADELIVAVEPRQADDRRVRVQRVQGRAISSSTDEFLVSENAWRKGGAPSHGSTMFAAINSRINGLRPAARRDHPFGQRRLHRLAEGIAGNEARFRRAADQARARDRAHQVGVHQLQPGCRIPVEGHVARARQARAAHHPHLSGVLPLLRRARVHLEQDPPVQPQSAARHGHRRRRPEDRLHQGGRLRPGRLRGAERLEIDRRRQWLEDGR